MDSQEIINKKSYLCDGPSCDVKTNIPVLFMYNGNVIHKTFHSMKFYKKFLDSKKKID